MAAISFGSDPEFMMVSKEGNLVSAIGRIGGTKLAKLTLGNGHFAFYDNVLVEVNVRPAATEEAFIQSFQDCLKRISHVAGECVLVCRSSANYPEDECKHPDAMIFGCDPEFCVYRMQQLLPPTCEDGNTFRSAGGHIHLGVAENSYPLMLPIKENDPMSVVARDWGRAWVVRMMDLFVGLPSILLDREPASAARRQLYGQAGTHRPKDYGVEYRPLSNFWFASPRITRLIYRLAMHSVSFVARKGHERLWRMDENGITSSECNAYDVKHLQDCINKSDIAMAQKMMEDVVKPNMPEELFIEVFQMTEASFGNLYKEWGI